MMPNRHFTIEDIKRSKVAAINQNIFHDIRVTNNKQKQIVLQKRSKEKDWLSWNLQYWCNEKSLTLETEYKFHPARKYRFDWAIPALKVACEYEGIISKKSRHTTIKGFNADSDKYNLAQSMGWKVFRITAINYKSIIQRLNDYMELNK